MSETVKKPIYLRTNEQVQNSALIEVLPWKEIVKRESSVLYFSTVFVIWKHSCFLHMVIQVWTFLNNVDNTKTWDLFIVFTALPSV